MIISKKTKFNIYGVQSCMRKSWKEIQLTEKIIIYIPSPYKLYVNGYLAGAHNSATEMYRLMRRYQSINYRCTLALFTHIHTSHNLC